MNPAKLIAAGAVLASLPLAGCTSDGTPSPSPAAATSPTTSGVAPADEDKRKQAIVELHHAVDTAWNAGDADAFAEAWVESGTVVSPLGQLSIGRATIRTEQAAGFAGPMKGTRHKLTLSRVSWPQPDVAVVDGAAQISGFRGSDGKAQPPLTARFTSVCVQRQGRWLISDLRSYVYLKP